MQNWWRNIGGALRIGLCWAVAGFVLAIPMEAFIDPDGEVADVWPAVLGYPGFFGGVLFFALIRVFERRRGLSDLSLSRAAAWGALSGVLLPVLFALALFLGLGTPNGPTPWPLIRLVVTATTLSFAVAGAVSVALDRWFSSRTPSHSADPGRA
jgi:uncharacterized membrane protein YbhN (UPF0104 family)